MKIVHLIVVYIYNIYNCSIIKKKINMYKYIYNFHHNLNILLYYF